MASGRDGPDIKIAGASKLTDLYGYWPSFHDATVESILIERVGPTVTIRFETCDMASDGDAVRDPDRQATVVIRWRQVRDLDIKGVDAEGRNWIDGLTFVTRGEGVQTELLLMDGVKGIIVAKWVEVLEVH